MTRLDERVLTAQIFSVDHGKFQEALRKWFPKPLDNSACANLICRLDEYNIGTVNATVLDEFAGQNSLELKEAEYMFKSRTTSVDASAPPRVHSYPLQDVSVRISETSVSGTTNETLPSTSTIAIST